MRVSKNHIEPSEWQLGFGQHIFSDLISRDIYRVCMNPQA